jgi:hypothetical protein
MLDANGRLDLQVTGCCLRSPYSETIFQKRFLVIWRSLAELVEALLKLIARGGMLRSRPRSDGLRL